MAWLYREQREPQWLAPCGFSPGTLGMRWRPQRHKGRNRLPAQGRFQAFQLCSYSDRKISATFAVSLLLTACLEPGRAGDLDSEVKPLSWGQTVGHRKI